MKNEIIKILKIILIIVISSLCIITISILNINKNSSNNLTVFLHNQEQNELNTKFKIEPSNTQTTNTKENQNVNLDEIGIQEKYRIKEENNQKFILQELNSTNQFYARIETENIYFYSQAVDNNIYKMFEIPKTYFVLLTGNAGDEQDMFYLATYMDKNGYVKKNEVKPVVNKPMKPFANDLSFSIYSLSGLDLREKPEITPFNIITNIPFLEKNLIYYGDIIGEEMVPELGEQWYYCKYLSGNNSYYGYLYAPYCYLGPYYSPNTEIVEYYNGELFENKNTPTSTSPENPILLSNEIKIIIIICACLPCLFIIYLLFKPTKIMLDNGNQSNKKKYNKLKKSEYYEYDD